MFPADEVSATATELIYRDDRYRYPAEIALSGGFSVLEDFTLPESCDGSLATFTVAAD